MILIQQLCVYIITWNVNSQFPSQKVSVDGLLGVDYQQGTLKSCSTPDLYVIGLQEVNSKPESLVVRLFKDDAWVSKFRHVLGPKDYVTIKVEQMQGILIIVFSKKKHLLHLQDIESQNTRRGIGGFWGNKGAVSVRMNLYGSATTFVNAHLPAHDDELNKRIEDYNHIIENHHYHVNQYRQILNHDYVFWLGDLNFRLEDPQLSAKNIRTMIRDNRLEELFQKDQLNLIRREGIAFQQFLEQRPEFPPTFKFHLGTSEYNMKRRPAWTDRILYRMNSDNLIYKNFTLGVEQVSYDSHPEYTISDHKPVVGQLLVNVMENPTTKIVEFSYIPVWRITEGNFIEFTLQDGFEEDAGDWIGIFPSDYTSLNDYLAFEYTSHAWKDLNKRFMRIQFEDNINIVAGREYMLLYFKSPVMRQIITVAGISNVFKAEK